MTDSTLVVEDLKTYFFTRAGVARAVDGVSFRIGPGRIMGLVGESGSGKSVTGFSIIGLVDPPGRIAGGRVLFRGEDLLTLPEHRLRAVRGAQIAMIFQDPMMTLNPVMSIGAQMIETVLAHEDVDRATARQRARDVLGMVGISSPEERLDAYPHQFSGGMRQRVVIAIALLHRPDLIIADEPTTALDVTIQSQILAQVQKLCREQNTSLIWISHDLSVVSGLVDDICIMYAGRIVESGPVERVLAAPRHPYTVGLIGSLPSRNKRGRPLKEIPGVTPSLIDLDEGCSFRARCFRAAPDCALTPHLEPVNGTTRHVRCFHPVLEGQP